MEKCVFKAGSCEDSVEGTNCGSRTDSTECGNTNNCVWTTNPWYLYMWN